MRRDGPERIATHIACSVAEAGYLQERTGMIADEAELDAMTGQGGAACGEGIVVAFDEVLGVWVESGEP